MGVVFRSLFAQSIVVLLSAGAAAQVANDVRGSGDYPGIGRYPGSFISQYTATPYDEGIYPLTPNSYEAPTGFESLPIKGERTTIIYDVPNDAGATPVGVLRSLEAGLKKQGFQVDLACSGDKDECGRFFVRELMSRDEIRERYARFKEFYNLNGAAVSIISARKDAVHALAVVGKSKYSRFIQYSVDVFEDGELAIQDLVLTEAKLEADIDAAGRARLSGVNFETGSATLTADSTAALDAIAAYLAARPNEHFLVVGHTDTEGGFGYNVQLSERRAMAVIKYLEQAKSISPHRLRSVGAGYAAPLATNKAPDGRAENRRVELVWEKSE